MSLAKDQSGGVPEQGQNPRELYPPSPCISVCAIGEDERCLGCSRTLQEISLWTSMSKEQQWAVVDELALRD